MPFYLDTDWLKYLCKHTRCVAEFEQQCLNKPPVAAPSFHSPTIAHVATGGEGWSGQGEGAQHEDVQVCVLALCSPLPALTIPPHWLTVQPANHCCYPRIPDPTHTFSPATHASPGTMAGCHHPVYATAAAFYSPLPYSNPLPHSRPSHASLSPVHTSPPLMVRAAHPLDAAHLC